MEDAQEHELEVGVYNVDTTGMTQQPDPGPSVGPEKAPADVDTSPTAEDGVQDVDQNPHYEVAESDDNDDDDDPEVHEVA
jgi:hypothetical protein